MTDRLSIRLAAGSGPTFGVDDLSCAAPVNEPMMNACAQLGLAG